MATLALPPQCSEFENVLQHVCMTAHVEEMMGQLKADNVELKADNAELKTQMQHVLKTIAMITSPPSFPPVSPPSPPSPSPVPPPSP
eukprot:CAMPEP_0181203304 /NCGR_PEP_ID=MMETSP1096-20121128/19310_1 /TAXON_ID=156174 ORGANISM="Chrysochromulina ericina, Strain CCMP281" /NCGR_SAMPLE_ID=MMETSP1096 /ASSEMBLY_ACC=CAM_ASM_000453 /LENGTH=86 /DNA_ID=CAMNT_0023293887 /DNA_START=142 /DNA_END=398 /DNA_ORIENTATION=+